MLLLQKQEEFLKHCCALSFLRIPDSIGKDIEKACQSIYPLHDVYVRKVKMLKKPKFECKSFMADIWKRAWRGVCLNVFAFWIKMLEQCQWASVVVEGK